MVASLACAALACCAAYFLYRLAVRLAGWLIWLRRLSALPVPSGYTAAALADQRHHLRVLEWDAEVGPIFCLPVLWARAVVVTDPHLVHQLLRATPGVDKAQITYGMITPLFSSKGYPSLFSASTHSRYWRLVRKGVAPGFSSTSLRGSFKHIQAVVEEVVGVLSVLGPDQAFDVDNLLMRATMDVIGLVGFQTSFRAVQGFQAGGTAAEGSSGTPPEGQDIFTTINESMAEVNKRWANPMRAQYLWWLPEVRTAMRHWRAFRARMRTLAEGIRGRGQPADGDQSIAAHLLRLRDPHTGQPLSVERLVPEIATFFVAGMDTTAHTMAWTLYLLSQHPEVEARVAAELDALGLLATLQRPEPRQVQWEDLGRLPFLSATIKESMRMLPVGADGTAVEVDHDCQLGGYDIPANTTLWVHMFTTHNSPRYWDEPQRFHPDRFLQPGAEYASAGPLGRAEEAAAAEAAGTAEAAGAAGAAAAGTAAAGAAGPERCSSFDGGGGGGGGGGSISRPAAATMGSGGPLRFFPFSQGPRDCVGQQLAKLNYTATLASLLGRFTFRLAAQSSGPDGVQGVVKLTLQPESGIFVHAVPRMAGA